MGWGRARGWEVEAWEEKIQMNREKSMEKMIVFEEECREVKWRRDLNVPEVNATVGCKREIIV